MNIFDQLPYGYRGFGEGEYIYNFFLDDGFSKKISPRDLLAIYWKLRGFTPNLLPSEIRPSLLRTPGALQVVETVATVLEGHELTIYYQKEGLTKRLGKEAATAATEACQHYACVCADCQLTAEETEHLLDLNEKIRQTENNTRQRASQLCQFQLQQYETVEISLIYNFHMREDHPEYHGPWCSLLFQSTCCDGLTSQEELRLFRENMLVQDCRDYNEKRHIKGSLYQSAYCRMFNEMEDWSSIPLRHLCRINKIEGQIGIECRQVYI